jgi:uroporphyrinogen decarboxylase
VESAGDIRKLPRPDVGASLGYVMDAIALTRRELGGKVPLIGFSGSPWTLATYMIEGGSSKSFSKAKNLLYQEPAAAHELLGKLADTVTDYLNAQIDSGAQAVQIFDTWGGALSADAYREFSLAYMQRIVEGLKRENDGRRVPVILFSKGCNTQLEALAGTGCDALGVDWTVTLGEARSRVGGQVALQGNLDPAILLAERDVIRREAEPRARKLRQRRGPRVQPRSRDHAGRRPDNLAALIDAVRELSPAFHS